MTNIGIKELLDAGVHFGHLTRRWPPKMKRFIFDARNGIHIIDLSQTLGQLEEACKFLSGVVRKGGQVLFVGTKKQAQEAIKETAKACGQPYVTERWLGGTLTNMKTIKRSMGRLHEIEKMVEDGSINNYVKQEQSMLKRELARLIKNLDGIRTLDKPPSAIFIVDLKRERNAVLEARRLKIPLVALVDTNCDPDVTTYPIAGNDDATRSVKLILSLVTETLTLARAEYETKHAQQKEAEAKAAAEKAAAAAASAAAASPSPTAVGAPTTRPSGSPAPTPVPVPPPTSVPTPTSAQPASPAPGPEAPAAPMSPSAVSEPTPTPKPAPAPATVPAEPTPAASPAQS